MQDSSPIAARTITSVKLSVVSSANTVYERLTGVFSVLNKELLDLVANLTLWNLYIILLVAVIGHEREEAVVGNIKLKVICQRSGKLVRTSSG